MDVNLTSDEIDLVFSLVKLVDEDFCKIHEVPVPDNLWQTVGRLHFKIGEIAVDGKD